MAWRGLVAGLAIASLAACSDSGTQSQATPSAALSAANPPAQTAPAAGESQAVAVVEAMQVDLEKRLVYLPSEGWLNEDEFWYIYYNEPQRLPGTLDVEGLNALGYHGPPPAAPLSGGGA